MITECMCGHYREEHRSHGDDCSFCDCIKYRAGREVDPRAQVARKDVGLLTIRNITAAFKDTKLRGDGGLCMCDAEVCIVHDVLREANAALR